MKIKSILVILITLISFGCNNSPKIITSTPESENSSKNSGIFSEEPSNEINANRNTAFSDDLHTVVVNEVLPAAKYVYINVNEGKEQFWIATRKADVKVGNTYYFKGGLLKTNFESKEYNRVFEKVYLISSLVESNHGANSGALEVNKPVAKLKEPTKKEIEAHTEKVVQQKGSMKIAELVKAPEKYEGKTVQISGICTKINAGIMERNWIHIKDGSNDDFDLVITSDVYVPEGSEITIKALVTLHKDFGSGYTYDLILENGILVK